MMKEFKLNVPLRGFPAGKIITLECDNKGEPLNMYWFRRFRDSKNDFCLAAVNKEVSKKAKDAKNESIKPGS